jgi:Aspartyl protease
MAKEKTAGWLLALVLLSVTGLRGTSDRDIRFQLIRESVITVPVLVNGRGPFDFVFDTGTESSLMDFDLARELNISPIERVRVVNPAGEKLFVRAFADEVSLGPLRVLHSEIVVGNLDGLHAVSPRIRGVIGQNLLSHFDYVIDYAHSMIEFVPVARLDEPIRGMKTKIARRHGCPVLTGYAPSGGEVNLVLDSGSSELVLYNAKMRGSAPVVDARMATSSGAIETHTGGIPSLAIGTISLRGLRAAFSKSLEASDIDGLLPTRLFSAVYFNNSEGYVVLRPR